MLPMVQIYIFGAEFHLSRVSIHAVRIISRCVLYNFHFAFFLVTTTKDYQYTLYTYYQYNVYW